LEKERRVVRNAVETTTSSQKNSGRRLQAERKDEENSYLLLGKEVEKSAIKESQFLK